MDRLPKVNLHGDAHVEQYAVSRSGQGLSDFDYAAVGPPIIDQLRFLASVRLVAGERGWQGEVPRVAASFWSGYRAELQGRASLSLPQAVLRLRSALGGDEETILHASEELMEPLSNDRQFRTVFRNYVAIMGRRAKYKPGAFTVKKLGVSRKGVGSALQEKYLARLEGPSRHPEDDWILEAKRAVSVSGAEDCVSPIPGSGSQAAASRLAYFPYVNLSRITTPEGSYWVHAWLPDYKEISATDSVDSPAELAELAEDCGRRLARGHLFGPVGEARRVRKAELLRAVEDWGGEVDAVAEDVALAAVQAWQQYRARRTKSD